MRIAIPFSEALAFGTSTSPLPPMIVGIRCEGSTVSWDVDLRLVPTPSFALGLAFAAAGVVEVTARVVGFVDGIATLAVTAHARGLPAHKLLPYLIEQIEAGVRDAGLPDGLVQVQRGDTEPWVLIDVQKAVASRVEGLTITGFDIRDAVIQLAARVGEFRVI